MIMCKSVVGDFTFVLFLSVVAFSVAEKTFKINTKGVDIRYVFHSENVTWYQARDRCSASGGLLLVPEDEAEAKAVMAQLAADTKVTWVGINDLETNDAYRTIDGRHICTVYQVWANNQPYSRGGTWHCVGLWGDSTMFVAGCDARQPAVCKFPPSTPRPQRQNVFSAKNGECSGVGGIMGAVVTGALEYFSAQQCSIKEDWPHNSGATNMTFVDFIVVGGGTAGSTVAARLAEVSTYKVLLIEAGSDPPTESIVPALHATQIAGEFDWRYTTVDDGVTSQSLEGGSQALPSGKMLGGSGSLNEMVYSRGYPADYNEWAETLGDTWNWNSVLPYFLKTEHLTDERIVEDPELMKLHGTNGEIEVAGLKESSFETDQFLQAFNESGFKLVKDMTNPNEIGAGRHSHTIRDGRRDSSLTSLLMKNRNKDNLFVLKNALVTKVIINEHNKKAKSVDIRIGTETYRIRATKEVIVSAGVFNTPKLLMLSGIGPEEHLRQKGIPVVKNLPVGENLHDHVMVLNYITADNGTCFTDAATSHMNTIRYLYDRSGPLAVINTMAAYMALANSSQPNLPDYALYPSCLPIGTPFYDPCRNILRFKDSICSKLQELLKNRELITVAIVLMKPKSRGRVLLKSTNPLDPPLIHPGTFTNADDYQRYPEAMEVVKRIVDSSYFRKKKASLVDLGIAECAGKGGDDLVRCNARATVMSAWHSVGTAAMGSVVDDQLKVKGVVDLRVVDASVMPKVPRGNTNAPTIMIAERAAEMIKNSHQGH